MNSIPAHQPVATPLYRKVSLPGLVLEGNVWLAPIAGWTDAAFRQVCREMGAALAFTEMISAEAVVRGNPKTKGLLFRAPREEPFAVQIFTANPSSAAASIQHIRSSAPCLVDLNCGCSAPKILKSGGGAALLRNPQRIADILRAMRQEIDSPVAVKIRSGWDRDSINYLQVAEHAVQGGASMVTLHPRTRAEGFDGKADWSHITDLKRRMPVPVVGSGDLFHPQDIRNMLMQTSCDAVMVARGAMGNPFIFASALRLLTHGEPGEPPSASLRLETALKQLELAIGFKGEPVACREARKYFSAYIKGLHGAAAFRSRFTRAGSFAEFRHMAAEFLKSLGGG